VLFNNASDLPKRSTEDLAGFDLQYIQIPLRSVLTDAAVRIADNDQRETPILWLDLGKLSIVSTFFVPQGHVGSSLDDARSRNDLGWSSTSSTTTLPQRSGGTATLMSATRT